MRGITRSDTIIAGRNEVIFCIASSPLAASSVWKPQALTSSESPTRVAGSSSTIRTRSEMAAFSVTSATTSFSVDMLRAFLAPRRGDLVVDLGCGSGRALLWNRDWDAQAIGIDIAPYFASEARRDVDLLLGDLRRLPFADGAVTKAYSLDVLEHLSPEALKSMTTIPNALDLRALDAQTDPAMAARLREQQAIAPGEQVLLSVGRLEESKGFHVLLRSLAAVQEHGSLRHPWRWVVLGDGSYRPALERLAAELDLTAHVRFIGRAGDPEMHAWHEIATLFVHPTLYEGSSLVTLEAMAHRRAVVASAAGGIPDKVKPGENGWLVPPGDASALAAAISGALADEARRARYGTAGRRIVEREFSWDAAGDATVALYRRLLG